MSKINPKKALEGHPGRNTGRNPLKEVPGEAPSDILGEPSRVNPRENSVEIPG